LSLFRWGFTILFIYVFSAISQSEFQNPAYAQLIISIVYNADAGGGNATTPLNIFHPKNITINESANIKWQNPTLGIQYPHTVTFIRADSNLTIPNISFNLSNYSSLIEAKSQNAQNDKAAAVDVNAEILPTVISANGSITNLDPYGNLGGDGARYNFTGTENYVNSGFIWPEGDVPKGFANIISFTVQFEKQGVYHFQCLIHPEMRGNVTVTPPNTPMGISISDLGK
jgi:plastocyanin